MNAALATRPLDALLEGFASTPVPALGVTDLTLDSRAVTPGALFLAVAGTRVHGLAHAGMAIEHGATAIAYEPQDGLAVPTLPVPTIAVPKLGVHVGDIAARFHHQPASSLFTVGITGTDGKTSTAHLLAQALDTLQMPCAYFGTLGYGRLGALAGASHTTPDAVRLQGLLAMQRDAGAKACAMEVSSHALDQRRVGGLCFNIGVLTNVGRDHLDYHGTVEAYAAAKRRLFDADHAKAVVLNRDDAQGARWASELSAEDVDRVLVYGIGGDRPAQGAYVIARQVIPDAHGLHLVLRTHAGDVELRSPLLGRFNAYNLMAALGTLLLKGIPLDWSVAALAKATTVPGRIEAFRCADAMKPLVVVDYAHTPQALENVLDALRAHCAGRLICVFGAGGDRDRGKRPLMGAAVASRADFAIVTDDNPRSEDPAAIVAAILEGAPGKALTVVHDRAQAIDGAIAQAGADDIVLVAGKGHEATQTVGGDVRRFSDRDHVAARLGLEARA